MKRLSLLWLALFCLFIAGNRCTKNEPVPSASFSYSGDNGFLAPCHVIFENESANAFSFQWEFGDDSVSYMKEPSHTFMKSGNYEVRLRAYTESGKEWASVMKVVRIKSPPG